MPELIAPQVSVAAAVRRVADPADADAHPAYGRLLAGLGDAELPGWVQRLLAETRPAAPHDLGDPVATTHLWWVEGDTYLGRLAIRHALPPPPLWIGGHVGYWVCPDHRRRGHATAMLAAALPVAAQLGLDCVLVTCAAANAGSRRAIEANGGLFDGELDGQRRYWIPTGRPPA